MPNPSVPQHCPGPRELDDLELLTTGALAPTLAFGEPGSPVTLGLPPPSSSWRPQQAPSRSSTPKGSRWHGCRCRAVRSSR